MTRTSTQRHHRLLLRLPSDRGPAEENEHAGGALPPVDVARYVRVAEAIES